MKYAITGVVIVLIGVAAYMANKPIVAENVQTVVQTVTETVEVSELDKRIKDAQDAKMGEIEAAAQAAYDSTLQQELRKVELAVTSEYRAEIEKREVELEKETGVY